MRQLDLSKVTVEKQKSKGGFNDIEDIKTNVKPRGADRLLRFKIASKNKQRQKLPILPPPAVLHRLPFVALKCEL